MTTTTTDATRWDACRVCYGYALLLDGRCHACHAAMTDARASAAARGVVAGALVSVPVDGMDRVGYVTGWTTRDYDAAGSRDYGQPRVSVCLRPGHYVHALPANVTVI